MEQINYSKLGYNPDCGSWNIKLNLEANAQYSAHGLSRLQEGYLRSDEPTVQHRLANIARLLSSDKAHAQRMYDYMSKMWYSPSTPQLAYGRTEMGQPVACYLPYLDDTAESLIEVSNEVKVMNMLGGAAGVGMFIRGAKGKSTGVLAHAKTYDADIVAYQQQGTRRGAVAVSLRIDHPDIEQFLSARIPGGDDKLKLHKAYQGVVLTKEFMTKLEALFKGGLTAEEKVEMDKFTLTHPATGVTATASVKELTNKLISARVEHQQPFIMFEDNANGDDEWLYKETGLKVHNSNLCHEITLSTSPTHSAVCVLGSVNAEKFDEFESHQSFIGDVTEFLDNSITVFINNINNLGDEHKFIKAAMQKAVRGAELERSIGIGMLGFHSYLQSRFVPFSSIVAVSIARKMSHYIQKRAEARSFNLGFSRGVAPLFKQVSPELFNDPVYGSKMRRNVKLIAIAPNASSSIILDTSPSIEPYCANVYMETGTVGSHTKWNKNLIKYLDSLGLTEEKIKELKLSIINAQGSVQHLTEDLTLQAREVFRCAHEVDQLDIIKIAAARQEFVDQAQSLNLFLTSDIDIKYAVALHIKAWKSGLKTMYYCYRHSTHKVNVIKEINLDNTCIACE